MKRYALLLSLLTVAAASAPASADESLAKVASEVNKRLVKVFGSGGFRTLVDYGTGILVSPDGHVLTVANHLLDTPDLRVYLADGRRMKAKLLATEPQLDVALLQIEKVSGLPYYDIEELAKREVVPVGTGVLAFSNMFKISEGDEPLSVMRGAVSAYAKLHGRRGIFDASFRNEVYVVDAITNNPGAAGGALTTRKGDLIGIIGKELRNSLTETYINYAVPLQSKVEAVRDDKTVTVSIADFVRLARTGEYKQLNPLEKREGPGGFHGIVLVLEPAGLERTPPYVDTVIPNSPAARAGIRADDLIVYVNGEQVATIKKFRELVDSAPPGTEIQLEVRRGDKLDTVSFKMDEPRTKAVAKPKP